MTLTAGTPAPHDPAPLKGVDFHQAPKPVDWALADEATLPNGRFVAGAKARVYSLLELAVARQHRFPIGRHLAPPGWVPTWVLREPWAGGTAGDRRVRDLRQAGLSVEGKRFQAPDEETASWIFHLGEGSAPATAGRNQRSKPTGAPALVSSAGPALPLSKLTVRAGCYAGDAHGAPICDLQGLEHPLSPPPTIFERVAAKDAAEYRDHLLSRWRDGSLQASLPSDGELYFLFPEGREDLAEVLVAALCKLGATRI